MAKYRPASDYSVEALFIGSVPVHDECDGEIVSEAVDGEGTWLVLLEDRCLMLPDAVFRERYDADNPIKE